MSAGPTAAADPVGADARRYAVTAVATPVAIALLAACRLPAAFLMGAVLAAALSCLTGGRARLPAVLFAAAQGVVGCLIARVLTVPLFRTVGHDWPVFAGVALLVMAVSFGVGAVLARLRILPGTTAIWGCSPGAAGPMVLMAERFGADTRLVAVMQYLRVAVVGLTAAVVARFATPSHHATAGGHAHATGHALFTVAATGAVTPEAVAASVLVIAVAVPLGIRLRVPAGAFLAPMALGAAVADTGLSPLALPAPLLAAGYILLGWGIGFRFDRPILAHAARAMPAILLSLAVTVVLCALIGLALGRLEGVGAMTAYLATSPGGADGVAVIASATPVDVPFVMAMQVARFLLVLAAGPPLARAVARRLRPAS